MNEITSPTDDLARSIDRLVKGTVSKRLRALRTLKGLGREAEPVLPLLVRALADVSLEVRAAAADVLAGLGAPAVPALLDLLAGDDPDQRKAAVVVLGQIGPEAEGAVPVLTDALEDDWLWRPALEALQKIRNPPRRSRRRWWLGMLAAAVTLSAVVAGSVCWLLPETLTLPPFMWTAAAGLGLISATLGGFVGAHAGGTRLGLLLTVMYALAGVCAGIILAAIFGSLVEPVTRVLDS